MESILKENSSDLHTSTETRGSFVQETQLLTPQGWKEISDITLEDLVIQWNVEGSMEFVKPIRMSTVISPYTVEIKNHQGHFNQEVSPNHHLLYEHKGIIKHASATSLTEIKYRSTSNYIHAGALSLVGEGLSLRERLLIAIQADGHYNLPLKRTGQKIGAVPVMFTFMKQRKIDRLISLATEAGLRLDERKTDKRGRRIFALYIPSNDQILWPRDKKLSSISDLGSVSGQWCKEFVDEAALWDGHQIKENVKRITWRCIDKENTEYLQAIASLAGYRTHFSMYSSGIENHSDIYTIQIARHLNVTSVQTVKFEINNAPQSVYGVIVPSGYILTRRNGAVSVACDSSF